MDFSISLGRLSAVGCPLAKYGPLANESFVLFTKRNGFASGQSAVIDLPCSSHGRPPPPPTAATAAAAAAEIPPTRSHHHTHHRRRPPPRDLGPPPLAAVPRARRLRLPHLPPRRPLLPHLPPPVPRPPPAAAPRPLRQAPRASETSLPSCPSAASPTRTARPPSAAPISSSPGSPTTRASGTSPTAATATFSSTTGNTGCSPPTTRSPACCTGSPRVRELYILSPPEQPHGSFRLVCVHEDGLQVRAVVFSSDTGEWQVLPWAQAAAINKDHPEDDKHCLPPRTGKLVDGRIYWTRHDYVIVLDTAALQFSSMDLPPYMYGQKPFVVGETKDDKLCMVCAIDEEDTIAVWVWRADAGHVEEWVLEKEIEVEDLSVLKLVAVKQGFVHLH
ncbi:hypothetical protein ACQ4PT_010879 [Festuca glaucescens]